MKHKKPPAEASGFFLVSLLEMRPMNTLPTLKCKKITDRKRIMARQRSKGVRKRISRLRPKKQLTLWNEFGADCYHKKLYVEEGVSPV